MNDQKGRLPSRDEALGLMHSYTASDSLRRHMLAVETAMIAYARRFGEDKLRWGLVGLLHDFDYERWPNPPDHPLAGAAILKQHNYPEDVIYAIKSHVDQIGDCPRRSLMDKALYSVDELCGFVVACAYLNPRGLKGLSVASVQKKMKQKSFAAAVDRKAIINGAAEIEVPLAEHIEFVIQALAANSDQLMPPRSVSAT